MYLSGKNLQLRRGGRRSNPIRVVFLMALILGGIFIVWLNGQGEVPDLFVPTPTATRNPQSWADEAEALFSSPGGLTRDPDPAKRFLAVQAYQKAIQIDRTNVDYRVALARMQIYARLYEEALTTSQDALLLAPNSAKTKAIYAWALDWNREGGITGCRCRNLGEAEAAAVQAISLDPNYAPAHAYYAEILTDSGKWDQAEQHAQQALDLDPSALDAHRAMALVNETVGNYEGAIEHYRDALAINPNLVMLYLGLGLNYRVLQRFEEATAAFGKANSIDPYDVDPLLSLSKTKYQTDELGVAVQYLEQALELEHDNPDIWGRLGLIYHKQKNYEDALPALELAVFGHSNGLPPSAAITPTPGPAPTAMVIQSEGLPLTKGSLEYYYTLATLYASLSDPAKRIDMCPQSLALVNQLLAEFSDDVTVQSVAADSLATCRNVEAGLSATQTPTVTRPAPAATATAPAPEATPIPTP